VNVPRFYLGTHMVSQPWFDLAVPLFVSRRRFRDRNGRPRKTLPVARVLWALDSGGFTELNRPPHRWKTTEDEYVSDVTRFRDEIGLLEWVAPMDWMNEPAILLKTGLTVAEHQRRTVDNFVRLRARLGPLVIPVVQGWTVDDYLRCWELYHRAGVDLEWERTVGVGSVCRRQDTAEAGRIIRALADNLLGTALHGFGVKTAGLESFGDALQSADSMAWSYRARRSPPLPGCTHASCSNCVRFASRWRDTVVERLGQLRLEAAA
jgi:hypothetical protein